MKRALLAAGLVGIQVGAAIVATRAVADEVGPATLTLMRYAIGVTSLVPAVLLTGWRPVPRGDVLPVALLGIGQFGVLVALLTMGLTRIGAGPGAIVFALFPLLTFAISVALGREPLRLVTVLGVTVSVLGVAVCLADTVRIEGGAAAWTGGALVLAAAAMGAICSVLYRPYLQRSSPLQLGVIAMAASVAALVPVAALEPWPVLAPQGWGLVLFIGLSSGIGYWLWLWALAKAPPTRVTVFLGLSPITASVLGVVLLDELATWALAAGAALVVAGQVLVARARS